MRWRLDRIRPRLLRSLWEPTTTITSTTAMIIIIILIMFVTIATVRGTVQGRILRDYPKVRFRRSCSLGNDPNSQQQVIGFVPILISHHTVRRNYSNGGLALLSSLCRRRAWHVQQRLQPTTAAVLLCSRGISYPSSPFRDFSDRATTATTVISGTDQETHSLFPLEGTPCVFMWDFNLPEGRCIAIQMPQLSHDNKRNRDYDEEEEDSLLTPRSIQNNPHHWIGKWLHPDEIRLAMSLASSSSYNAMQSFLLGRLAMHCALSMMTTTTTTTSKKTPVLSFDSFVSTQRQQRICILKDANGGPKMPTGYLGSISHKDSTAVALVSPATSITTTTSSSSTTTTTTSLNQTLGVATTSLSSSVSPSRRGIGIDLERSQRPRHKPNIARRVLTSHEYMSLGQLPGISAEQEVLLRFSLKESFYKAMYGLVNQYMSFQHVQVQPNADGTATFTLVNTTTAPWIATIQKDGTRLNMTAHWKEISDFFLTSCSVELTTVVEALPEN